MNLTSDQVGKLLAQPESQTLVFKAVLPPSKGIAQIMAAFANSDGGTLILGVWVRPTGNQARGLSGDFHALDITHKALDLLTPRPAVAFNYVQFNGKQLYFIAVEKAATIVLLEGRHYYRQGATTRVKEEVEASPEFRAYTFRRLDSLYVKYQLFREKSTNAKAKFLEHYLSMLRIFNDLGGILYPTGPEEPTTNAEGKILTRILYSSAMDNFETYLSDILYEIFLANPQTLKSEQTVTVKEVLNCTDLQEFIKYWAKQKIGKLQKGSVAGFIKENEQIEKLKAIEASEQKELEKLLQIRHLYAHRNGIIDEKFLTHFREGHSLGVEHQMALSEVCHKLEYVAEIVEKLDNAAVLKFSLST